LGPLFFCPHATTLRTSGWARTASIPILTATLRFQVPPAPPAAGTDRDQPAGHSFVLWAEARFSRPLPDNQQGPDNLWLHLETGPIRLNLAAPRPEQQLQADLQADRDGWSLQVTDAAGQRPCGPLWGWLEAASSSGARAQPLADNPTGAWSASWGRYLVESGSAVAVRAWIAAPGYATAAVTATVSGTGDTGQAFYAPEPPQRQSFSSLEAAQATLDFPVYRPGTLPEGAALEGIQVDTWAYEESRRVEVRQAYRLAGGAWLELIQMATSQPYAGFGWGQAHWAPEAQPVEVGLAEGYAARRLGWWLLDWKRGDAGLEL
jgi:hypothetical protein